MPYADATQAGRASGDVHRLPRPGDDAPAGDAARVHRRASGRWPSPSEPMPHLPSIERWRKGDAEARSTTPTPTPAAQEMRSMACGQCHVEYYFKGEGKLLTYPWHNGLKVEQIEKYYDDEGSKDWTHAVSGAAGAQGAAPGVRDVEPGDPRPQRRGVRRLPHALHARGGDQGQRPPRPQPAAEHRAGLPDVPPLRGERDPSRVEAIQDRTQVAADPRRGAPRWT